MYRFLDKWDKKLVDEMKRVCNQIVKELQNEINDEDFFQVEIRLVGSGRKNLITQNGNNPIDLDYNLLITNWDKNTVKINSCREIKKYFIDKTNEILSHHKYRNCQDSTSAITSQKFKSKTKRGTLFSFDIAITIDDNEDNTRYRLIHKKTGRIQNDSWAWEAMPNSNDIDPKANFLKQNQLWDEIKQAYLQKKNMYLKRNDKNHPSYICYIEAVNEVYYSYCDK